MKFNFTKKQYFVFIVSSVILSAIILLSIFANTLFLYSDNVEFSKTVGFIFKISFLIVSIQLVLAILQSNFISDVESATKLDVTGTNTKTDLEHKLKNIEKDGNVNNIAIIMLDINDLKYINDHFGHDSGDVIIWNFAQFIKKAVSPDVFVARFGGDEFICIDENSTVKKVEDFHKALNHLISAYNQKNDVKITYAFGYEINSQENPLSLKELFRSADQNMYKNKRALKSEGTKITASKDSVTGLLANDSFAQVFEKNIEENINLRQLAVEFTDFSNFHYINDLSGKTSGDEILKTFACKIAESKNTICASRLFSDYFVSLLDVTGLSEREIENLIFIRNRGFEDSIIHQFKLASFKINSGIYMVNRQVSSVSEMIQGANIARNNAKIQNTGVCLYSHAINGFELKRSQILDSFKNALKHNEFAVYLQPKISVKNARIDGVEALSRWTFNGNIRWTPEEYIPALESSGDIILLDYYVFDKVFEWLYNRNKSGLGYEKVSMNISPVHLNNTALFFDYLNKLQKKYNIPEKFISFELSEAAWMQKQETVSDFITSLHKLGFKVSLDDFKSSYSSLNTLENLPFDEIKINHNFTSPEISFSDKMILKSVISMIKEMDKVVVCQGIENKNQIDFLKAENCDFIQGFYYSKPVPLDSFENVYSKFA